MTDIDNGTWLSDAELDAIASQDVHLDDEASIAAEQSRRDRDRIVQLESLVEWNRDQRESAERAQAAAEEQTRAAEERAQQARDERDSYAQHARDLIAYMVGQRAGDRGLDTPERVIEDIADGLLDEMGEGLRPDQIDPDPQLDAWARGEL